MSRQTVVYAAVGPDIFRYSLDVEAGTLDLRDGVATVPANVQFACAHASGRFLYVASSDRAPGGLKPSGTAHHLSVFRIDPATGALTPHGAPVPIASGPIHVSTDAGSRHLLIAYVNPARLEVYRLDADGALGAPVPTPAGLDAGVVPHEVSVTPDDRQAILVTRGHDAEHGRPEEPGALKVFDYDDGALANEVSIAPGGGYGFGPRNLAFHPAGPWVYVSLERQNELQVFLREDGRLSPAPIFREKTLRDPNVGGRQLVGTLQLHPSGRFVYVANRAATRTLVDGRPVITGENTIAAFAIDESDGRPSLLQHADTMGVHCRTLQLDPSGRLMVCGHIAGESGHAPRLTLFRVADDGRLTFLRAYEAPTRDQAWLWWMGMVQI